MSLINIVYYSTTFGVKIFVGWSDTELNERLCPAPHPAGRRHLHHRRLHLLQGDRTGPAGELPEPVLGGRRPAAGPQHCQGGQGHLPLPAARAGAAGDHDTAPTTAILPRRRGWWRCRRSRQSSPSSPSSRPCLTTSFW